MSIRMVCLALMIVVPGGWKLIMLAAAVLIPFFAVLFANDQNLEAKASHIPPADMLMLPAGGTTIVMDADGTFHDEDPDPDPNASDRDPGPPSAGHSRPHAHAQGSDQHAQRSEQEDPAQ